MKIFFDTETTGLPKNYNAPISDVDNYPRLVQLGYIVVANSNEPTLDSNIIFHSESIVKPVGFEIPAEASNVHGVTQAKAMLYGEDIAWVLSEFKSWVDKCDTVIGHNVKFDINVVGAEFWRLYGKSPLEGKPTICTMMSSIQFCKLPGRYDSQYKYPKLAELYFALFAEPMGHAHTALADIENTVKCYNALVEKGVIK